MADPHSLQILEPPIPNHVVCPKCASTNSYLPEESKVIYQSKACSRRRSGNGKEENVFDALEWLAAMSSHVPDKGEQMVRYYGYYSNVSRGKRKK